jgi:hypothetical protein
VIVQILLIKLVFEPAIDALLRVGFHCHREGVPSLLMIQEWAEMRAQKQKAEAPGGRRRSAQ